MAETQPGSKIPFSAWTVAALSLLLLAILLPVPSAGWVADGAGFM